MKVRDRFILTGAVQGVGFRPFVYRLAHELGLSGWVRNSPVGVEIEVEGEADRLAAFAARIDSERPRAAVILGQETSRRSPTGSRGFEIRPSTGEAGPTAGVLPDLATCPECLRELFDPSDRRHQYAFINCTRCGPRYTIINDIPYDRPNTTMRGFSLCDCCRREYDDPADRRFHAQPNACPVCGPRLTVPVADAASALREGKIIALKGIGGFQLLVDARDEAAVRRLRQRKNRESKPLALMLPGMRAVRAYCRVSEEEEALLQSAAAPVVLLEPEGEADIAPSVAGSSPWLGVMLPYSPLHHLLMRELAGPLVATSGNLSDEPIVIDNSEAERRLAGIADLLVMHDRPVTRPCDDSVARVMQGRVSMLRRARGYAPLPVRVKAEMPPLLAVGAHLKNAVAIAVGRQIYLSQHIGDLNTLEAREAFERAIDDLCRLYRFEPAAVACDRHPDYASSLWAQRSGLPVIQVQHHHAHVAACAAEHSVEGPYLGVAWDGAGYGEDGTVWGGEFFLVSDGRYRRVAHLRPFRLPGGEKAIREGWRCAASLRHELGLETTAERPIARMLDRDLHCPWTTSVGRLFDAVAALVGLARESRFEGELAMLLERAAMRHRTDDCYELPGGDWEQMVTAVIRDLQRGVAASEIAVRFHNGLARWIVAEAMSAGVRTVVVSGGVFQNRVLTERTIRGLEDAGFQVRAPRRVPANDGGIALGQIVVAGQQFQPTGISE